MYAPDVQVPAGTTLQLEDDIVIATVSEVVEQDLGDESVQEEQAAESDIPFDTLRLKRGGGEGGHNGLKSITASLGTKDYARVRVGIGRPPGRMDVADFVLRPFTKPEQDVLPLHVDRAADAVEKLVTDGLEAAQQAFH